MSSTVPQTGPHPEAIEISVVKPDFSVQFKHKGKTYRLYKRELTDEAPYHVRLKYKGERFRQSLDTHLKGPAVDRAKAYIDNVLSEAWDAVHSTKLRKKPKEPEPQSASASAPCATFKQVFDLYRGFALIDEDTIRNNITCMKLLFKRQGLTFDESMPISVLTAKFARDYQEACVKAYCKGKTTKDEKREARERSLRTSRSTLFQARSLFNKDKELPSRYQNAGLPLPDTLQEFMTVKLLGKMFKREYLPPADSVVQAAFNQVDDLVKIDPRSYVAFWLAVGAGLRRGEIHRCCWEHFIERDGVTWISGGIGKDGATVEVPMQTKAVEKLAPLRKQSGRVLGDLNSMEWAKKLNWWMTQRGWQTEKKMHELRAYIGSLLYQRSPVLAKTFLRHKTIKMTEQFYCRYVTIKPIDVL